VKKPTLLKLQTLLLKARKLLGDIVAKPRRELVQLNLKILLLKNQTKFLLSCLNLDGNFPRLLSSTHEKDVIIRVLLNRQILANNVPNQNDLLLFFKEWDILNAL